MDLPDIQDQPDDRGIALEAVGIAGVRYPVSFSDGRTDQASTATFDVSVTLPANRRGTHMSRMVEIIHDHLQEFDPRDLPAALKTAATRLEVDAVQIEVCLCLSFLVFAPSSGRPSWQPADIEIRAARDGDLSTVESSVSTDVTSLCPCSRAISDYGAHNQRSRVTLTTRGHDDSCYPLEVERAFALIRGIGSSPVYPLVKRSDERVLTMDAHDNAAFVEDMARDLSTACREQGIEHAVSVRNFESIHSHDAVARLNWSPA